MTTSPARPRSRNAPSQHKRRAMRAAAKMATFQRSPATPVQRSPATAVKITKAPRQTADDVATPSSPDPVLNLVDFSVVTEDGTVWREDSRYPQWLFETGRWR